MHSEVRAEEEVSDSQEQRLGQWSSSFIIIQLICLKKCGKSGILQKYLHFFKEKEENTPFYIWNEGI